MKRPLFYSMLLAVSFTCGAANVAYIHGDVSECGTTPAASETGLKRNGQPCSTEPYDQMLITDDGNTGLSQFAALMQEQGHTIAEFYDQATELNAQWLANKDVVIFGLHQKLWSAAERQALDVWLRAGGGMFIYSDSASGGFFREVGAQNNIGQTVTNRLIGPYDMQVTVDQADGTTGQMANANASIPGVAGATLEGEGVSPVAVSPSNNTVEILIPYTRPVTKRQGLTISNPEFASLALRPLGSGHIVVMFDRQPMWNQGPGSDINMQNNRAILRDVINFLAERPSPPVVPNPPNNNGVGSMSAIYLLLDDEQ